MKKILTPALVALSLVAATAHADDVIYGGLKLTDVKIDRVEGGEVIYATDSGQGHKTIKDDVILHITGNPSFNAAEDAWIGKKYSDAVDGYQKVLSLTVKPWLKDYVAARLQKAADLSGRFDAAVGAWSYLAQQDPAAAAKSKPAPPADPSSAFIKIAEAKLDSSAAAARTDDARQALLTYELELARYAKDDAGIARVSTQLVRSGLVTPGALLGLIHADLDGRKYKDAQQKLAQLKGPLADPSLENDRIFCLAEIANFTAPAASAAKEWEDIALEYMHVVANDPSGPLTPTALLRVAALHEKFDDVPTAIQIYTQLTKDYKEAADQKSVVEEAQKSISRLKAARG